MNTTLSKRLLMVMCAAGSMALSACGGGDDGPAPVPPTTEVPASASASVDGFISYLKTLVVASADTLEPVDVSAVTPPASETDEPQTVD